MKSLTECSFYKRKVCLKAPDRTSEIQSLKSQNVKKVPRFLGNNAFIDATWRTLVGMSTGRNDEAKYSGCIIRLKHGSKSGVASDINNGITRDRNAFIETKSILDRTCVAPDTSNPYCTADFCKVFRPSSAVYDDKKCRHIMIPPMKSPCGWFNAENIFNQCRFNKLYRPVCLYEPNVQGFRTTHIKIKGLGKKISSSTLHGTESVNDLRSWGLCKEDNRKYFLEQMLMSSTIDSEPDTDSGKREQQKGEDDSRMAERRIRDSKEEEIKKAMMKRIRELEAIINQGRLLEEKQRNKSNDNIDKQIQNEEHSGTSTEVQQPISPQNHSPDSVVKHTNSNDPPLAIEEVLREISEHLVERTNSNDPPLTVEEVLREVSEHFVQHTNSNDPPLPIEEVLREVSEHLVERTNSNDPPLTVEEVLREISEHLVERTNSNDEPLSVEEVLREVSEHLVEHTNSNELPPTVEEVLREVSEHLIERTNSNDNPQTDREVQNSSSESNEPSTSVAQLTTLNGLPLNINEVLQEVTPQSRSNEPSPISAAPPLNESLARKPQELCKAVRQLQELNIRLEQQEIENRNLQDEVNCLSQHVNDKTLNEAQLLAEMDNLVALLIGRQVELSELLKIHQNQIGVIQQLEIQLDIVHQAPQVDVSSQPLSGQPYKNLLDTSQYNHPNPSSPGLVVSSNTTPLNVSQPFQPALEIYNFYLNGQFVPHYLARDTNGRPIELCPLYDCFISKPVEQNPDNLRC